MRIGDDQLEGERPREPDRLAKAISDQRQLLQSRSFKFALATRHTIPYSMVSMKSLVTRPSAPHMPPRLAQSAFEMFADSGFANVNLDQIAARAGVTKGSLYWHYKNKKELILAACQHYYRQWQTDVEKAIARGASPLARLRLALVFSVDSCVIDTRNRLFTTGVFMLMQEDAEVRASWSAFYDAVRTFYVGLVAAAQREGELAGGDSRRKVDLMLEAMEGLKLRAGFEPHIARSPERRAIVEGLMGVFLQAGPAQRPRHGVCERRTRGKDGVK